MADVLKYVINKGPSNDEFNKQAEIMLKSISEGNKVCKMNKAIYGLKQAGRAWHELLNSKLQSLGFEPSKSDPCVYFNRSETNLITLVVYVDDILVMCKNLNKITNFGSKFGNIFGVKDIGEVKRCL